MEKLIFLAAIADEFAPLRLRLRNLRRGKATRFDFIELGVGVIDSIITLEKHAKLFSRNDRAVFLGTAGIIGNDFVPGETFYASFFRWTSIGLALKKGFLSDSLYQDIKAQKFFGDVQGLPVISTPEITADDKIALAFQKQNGLCLENLEAYGVARWFKSNNLSLAAFLSVTNQVGKKSHRQYLKHRKLAWVKLADTVYHVLMQEKNKD
ncbi:MAG TPA: hypothetical protein VJ624_09020 [Thermodesulfobacteriota bacterium]|nr:hypothetical protein [Thermodesulfobacteriota bacterium]